MALGKRRGRKMAGVGTRAGTSRIAGAILAAATVLLVGLVGASGASAEPNDTLAEADGPILSGSVYEGTLGTQNNVDWWVFYTGARTQVDIALLGLGRDDCFGPEMKLTDDAGQVIEETDTPAERNETKHILYTVGPGTNYVEIKPYYLNTSCGFGPEALYHLWINASPALLAAPPYIPPPPPPPPASVTTPTAPKPNRSAIRAAAECGHARTRVTGLMRKLRRARGVNYRNAIRRDIRRARAEVGRRC